MWSGVHDTGGSSLQSELSEVKMQMLALQDGVNYTMWSSVHDTRGSSLQSELSEVKMQILAL